MPLIPRITLQWPVHTATVGFLQTEQFCTPDPAGETRQGDHSYASALTVVAFVAAGMRLRNKEDRLSNEYTVQTRWYIGLAFGAAQAAEPAIFLYYQENTFRAL